MWRHILYLLIFQPIFPKPVLIWIEQKIADPASINI